MHALSKKQNFNNCRSLSAAINFATQANDGWIDATAAVIDMRQFSESNGNYWNRAMQDVHVFEVSPVGLISLCDTVLTHFNQWYAIFPEGGTVYYRWMCISFRFWLSVDSVPISAHINFRCWCADIASAEGWVPESDAVAQRICRKSKRSCEKW